MPFQSPVPIDSANHPLPVVTLTGGQTSQPIAFSGGLYWIGFDNASARAYLSTDGGVTYAEQDTAGRPVAGSGQIVGSWGVNQSGNALQLAWVDLGTQTLRLQSFSLVSQTWGPVTATAGFPVQSTQLCLVNSAGSAVVVYLAPDISPTETPIRCVVVTGAVFAASFDVAIHSPYFNALGQASPFANGVMSGTTMHLIFGAYDPLGPPPPDQNYVNVYQQIDTLTGTLGPFHVFPVESGTVTQTYQAGQPAIIGGNLVFPFYANFVAPLKVAVYTGPAATGGPFVLSAAIDPAASISFGSIGACSFDPTSGKLYLTYVAIGTGNQRGSIRAVSTTDGVTWTGETVIDSGVAGDLYQWPIVGYLADGAPVLVVQGFIGGTSQAFSFGQQVFRALFFAGQPLSGLRVSLRGVKRYPVKGTPPVCG